MAPGRFSLFSSRTRTGSKSERQQVELPPQDTVTGSGFRLPRTSVSSSRNETTTGSEAPGLHELSLGLLTTNLGPALDHGADDVVDVSRTPTYHTQESSAPSYTTRPGFPIPENDPATDRHSRISSWTAAVSSAGFVDPLHDTIPPYEDHPSVHDGNSTSGTSASSSSRRYVHYRIYTRHGAIASKYASDNGDPSLGRILSISVSPPHSVALLKMRLCDAEGIKDPRQTQVFLSCDADYPLEDTARLSLLSATGPGSSPQKPIALIVNQEQSKAFEHPPEFAHSRDFELDVTNSEPRYLYYRVYRNIGVVACKRPFDQGDPFLSRMNVNFITPPHTAHTIKSCLCFAEQLADGQDLQLFPDVYSDCGVDEDTPISILTGNGSGFTAENPMALVPYSKPTTGHRLKAKYNRPFYPSDPEWLSHSVGEILTFDGVRRSKDYYGTKYNVYLAQKASGQKGYVFASWCEAID